MGDETMGFSSPKMLSHEALGLQEMGDWEVLVELHDLQTHHLQQEDKSQSLAY